MTASLQPAEHLQLIAGLAAVLILLLTAACVYLFLCLRKQSRIISRREADGAALSERMGGLVNAIEAMSLRLEEVERRKAIMIEGFAEPASVNLNRRGQVLRLSRRGDSAGQIASALGLSQGEVKLTLRVHEMTG